MGKNWSGVSSLCRTAHCDGSLWTHSGEAESGKRHGVDCSQKHACGGTGQATEWHVRAQYDTSPLVSRDTAASSYSLTAVTVGLRGRGDKDGFFLKTCQFNCHLEIWTQGKTKCLETLKTLGLLRAFTANYSSTHFTVALLRCYMWFISTTWLFTTDFS